MRFLPVSVVAVCLCVVVSAGAQSKAPKDKQGRPFSWSNHPELFVSVSPGGSGYEPEKRVQENDGAESETIRFAPGDNAWDLAERYGRAMQAPSLNILIWVGTKGFNYEYNLKFSNYLNKLGVKHRKLVVEGVDHSAFGIYEKRGLELMRFHQENFRSRKDYRQDGP